MSDLEIQLSRPLVKVLLLVSRPLPKVLVSRLDNKIDEMLMISDGAKVGSFMAFFNIAIHKKWYHSDNILIRDLYEALI
jgi:hypothetical protein